MNQEIRANKQQEKRKSQKTKQQLFLHFLNLYSPHPNHLPPQKTPHQIQTLSTLLSQPPKNRQGRLLKKIKSQLSQLPCFKNPPSSQNAQFVEIFKRDQENIINFIAPFVEVTGYPRGTVVEGTGVGRRAVRVLVLGDVVEVEPINYKSFRNCQDRVKKGKIMFNVFNGEVIPNQSTLPQIPQNPQQRNENISQLQPSPQKQPPNQPNTQSQSPTKQSSKSLSQSPSLSQFSPSTTPTPPSYHFPTPQKILPQTEPLSFQKCRQLLTKCHIISPLSPHKQPRRIKIGEIVAEKDQPMFIDQKSEYYASAVCCTDCVFLEIGYDICRDVISLINTDRERPYIHSLLFKFPMLRYFQAKQYVTQQFMIAHEPPPQHQPQNPMPSPPKKTAIQVIKQLKIISSLNYELPYTGQLYLIISGTVTIIIDQISQRKPSTIQYAISQKSARGKEVLFLYRNDVFGVEDVGRDRRCNLRYLVSMGAKLLKINHDVMKSHMETVQGFKQLITQLSQTRNKILFQILQKMQQNLHNQQITRHSIITYSNPLQVPPLHPSTSTSSSPSLLPLKPKPKQTKSMQLTQHEHEIMQLKYFGHQNYETVSTQIREHFSPENTNLPKQTLSPDIVRETGLGIEFAIGLVRGKQEKIQIKDDGWIQIRNQKGALLRRKRIKDTDKSTQPETTPKSDSLLRRLGILNSKQIADHNLQLVQKRPSKYQFTDLNKQAKQFKKIREQVSSLPKLTKYYAKKEDRLFSILYKKTHV